ncbi:MAG: acetyl-CoA carboxylase biotin carboxylase subunit [Armatimonadetes bacterium]|nr:acetyl-CoA carboxylase biotin carboxylase subunit [Armatimonadota bacterium]
MFKKILIANRGEIAVRVIRACRELDIRTVAVHSDVDRDSLHVEIADETFCVGPGPVSQSYLNIPNVLSAALVAGADAIHPGYGFLAENADFVEICHSHDLTFIGPRVEAMRLMGDKARARRTVTEVGVPVLPGTQEIEEAEHAVVFGKEHGYPVMIKAAAGGGGKGMRVARDSEEMRRLFETARGEAESAFGDGRIYLEKFLPNARHIEFQILGDDHGNVIHLGERDCSVQRRNQKLIEESPSLALDPERRQEMGAAAVRAASACGYTGAGTVEFLFDPAGGRYYFLEMNTRIQVEHPVTEMVTGLDLVKEQIRIASGDRLHLSQNRVLLNGHSVECRINAERPDDDFAPSQGTISEVHFPGGPGVRIDSHLRPGYRVQPYYDSLLAKVITHGRDRDEALARMQRVLSEIRISGVDTTIGFHRRILNNPLFRRGEVHTTFIENEYRRELAEVS